VLTVGLLFLFFSHYLEYGNISGTDKSTNNTTKSYSGTFIDGDMNATVRWSDGRTVAYKGSVVGNKLNVNFIVNVVGSQFEGEISDCGVNSGTIAEVFTYP